LDTKFEEGKTGNAENVLTRGIYRASFGLQQVGEIDEQRVA